MGRVNFGPCRVSLKIVIWFHHLNFYVFVSSLKDGTLLPVLVM